MPRPFKLTKLGKAILKSASDPALAPLMDRRASARGTDEDQALRLEDIASARSSQAQVPIEPPVVDQPVVSRPAIASANPAPCDADTTAKPVDIDEVIEPQDEAAPQARCAPGWGTPMAMAERSRFDGIDTKFDLLPGDTAPVEPTQSARLVSDTSANGSIVIEVDSLRDAATGTPVYPRVDVQSAGQDGRSVIRVNGTELGQIADREEASPVVVTVVEARDQSARP